MKALSIIVLVLLLGVFSFYPHTTGPTEVGVRTIKWSLFAKKGVEDHVYAPGAGYFFPAILNEWHVLDTKLQNVEMTHEPRRGDKRFRDDVLFKTIGGHDVRREVIIVYGLEQQ